MAKKQQNSGPDSKAAKAYEKALKESQKTLSAQQEAWNQIGQSISGINFGALVKNVKLSNDEINQMSSSIKDMEKQILQMNDDLTNSMNSMMTKSGKMGKDLKKVLQSVGNVNKQMAKDLADSFKTGDMQSFFDKYGDEGVKVLENTKGWNKEITDIHKEQEKIKKSLTDTNETLDKGYKTLKGHNALISQIGDNIQKKFSFDKFVGALTKFDEQISSLQKNLGTTFGIFDKSTQAMSDLSIHGAQFGVSMEESFESVAELSDVLRTNNVPAMAEAVEQVQHIPGALGIARKDMIQLTGDMMLFGASAKDVEESAKSIASLSSKFGVNTKKVMESFSKNFKAFKTFGFKGGEESLARMAAKAEKMGISVESMFKVAEKTRTMEGAMEAAAELQLAGGSFANINPMQLLAASRGSAEDLQKLVGQIGSDIGEFNESGEFQINPVDRDRLQLAGDALGLSLEDMVQKVTMSATKTKKADLAGQMFAGFDQMSDEQKDFLLNATKIGEGGKLEMTAEVGGIDDLSKMTPELIDAAMEKTAADAKDLEARNKQNQSVKQSMENLMNSFVNVFSAFQPAMEMIASTLNWITEKWTGLMDSLKGHPIIKGLVGLTAALMLTLGPGTVLKGIISPLQTLGKGLTGIKDFATNGVKGLIGKGGAASQVTTPDSDVAQNTQGMQGAGPGGFLKGLAEGLKAMGDPKVFAGLGAVALAGPAFILFLPAIPGLILMSGVGLLDKLIVRGFGAMSQGLGVLGNNLVNIAKGSLAMALIGLSIIPFALAIQAFNNVEWSAMGKAAVGVIGLTAIVLGLGALVMSGVGAALLGGGIIALIGLGVGLAVFGASMLVAAIGFNAMAEVKWDSFGNMGMALLSVVPGMLAFGLASLVFLNPLTLISLGLMTMTLMGLAGVMTVLAPALSIASQSMVTMAAGIEQLAISVDKLDIDKLESLSEASAKMSTASAISGLVTAITGGGGEGGGETKVKLEPITIDLKLNGRQIQEMIIKDLKYTT